MFYIDQVFVEPQFRGRGYALKAVAIFLEILALREVVSCHPQPISDLKSEYSLKQGRELMKRYWSKLGLNKYNKKHNILWSESWSMPKWLKEEIFDKD